MGNDLAGVVEACGEGATRFAAGDRVFAFEEIGAAFACLEAGRAKGKVVVRMEER